jgi:hypothetical protein
MVMVIDDDDPVVGVCGSNLFLDINLPFLFSLIVVVFLVFSFFWLFIG